jgi:uncharacterized protein YndB with AHSA1/START domain
MAELRITRILPATRGRLWTAWTSADELARWFWPERFAAECRIDLRPGGAWRIASPALGIAVSGNYLVVQPTDRLEHTWRWDGEGEDTRVTVTFAAAAESGTFLTVVHAGFPTAEAAADHERGWNDCLDRLPGALAS